MRILAIALLLGASAGAEFRKIEQAVAPFECASCSQAAGAAIRKMRGVASAEMLMEQGLVRIELQEGNKVRLEAVRDALKGIGLTPKEARVVVRGRAAEGRFEVDGLNQAYSLSADKPLPEGELVTVEGVVPVQADPRAQPALRDVKRR